MIMEKERKQLINYGKKLVIEKLTKGTGGNLSVFDRSLGHIAITPSGIDFFEMKEEDIVILDLNGNVVEGENLPSSEWQMHLKLYKTRDDIDAVIHAHTMYSTVLACLHEELPATHYMIAVAGKNVKDLLNAFNIIEEVEYCSKIYCISKSIGNPVVLSDDEMKLMDKKFVSYGQRKAKEVR